MLTHPLVNAGLVVDLHFGLCHQGRLGSRLLLLKLYGHLTSAGRILNAAIVANTTTARRLRLQYCVVGLEDHLLRLRLQLLLLRRQGDEGRLTALNGVKEELLLGCLLRLLLNCAGKLLSEGDRLVNRSDNLDGLADGGG